MPRDIFDEEEWPDNSVIKARRLDYIEHELRRLIRPNDAVDKAEAIKQERELFATCGHTLFELVDRRPLARRLGYSVGDKDGRDD